MKTELNTEAKARFFAIYIGKAIVSFEFVNSPQHNFRTYLHPQNLIDIELGWKAFIGGTMPKIESSYLELKSISSITDEVSNNVARILGYSGDYKKDAVIDLFNCTD